MNTIIKCFVFLSLILPQHAISQVAKPIEPAKVASEIEKNLISDLPTYKKMRIQDSLMELQRYHYEYLSYKAKYELALVSQDKDERILAYKRIRNFPFYTVHVPFYGTEFAELYRKASRNLIYEYQGDLENLSSFVVIPSMQSTLYGFLKIEIEAAGGAWDRGDIPVPQEILDSIKTPRH